MSAIYRLTTSLEKVLTDTTLKTDFYNFPLKIARYRAFVVNSGTCATDRTSNDYNNIKAYILNLRRMEVERCIDLQLNGCGDGLKKARNGEACDDGNLISGDGCSSSCLVEFLWTCTSTENALSVCTAITCGNGVSNAGEECDDFNFVDNDGCTKCVEDIGYKCTGTTCKKMCGDGKVYT